MFKMMAGGKLMVDGQLYKKIIISNRSRGLIIDCGWKSGVLMHHNPGYRTIDLDKFILNGQGVMNVLQNIIDYMKSNGIGNVHTLRT